MLAHTSIKKSVAERSKAQAGQDDNLGVALEGDRGQHTHDCSDEVAVDTEHDEKADACCSFIYIEHQLWRPKNKDQLRRVSIWHC